MVFSFTNAPGSFKLEAFAETLGNLLANQYKALVFSQFVKYLKLIEKHLVNRLKDEGFNLGIEHLIHPLNACRDVWVACYLPYRIV